MGITPASKAFQTKMIGQFQGINGVSIIQHDCLVEGFGNNSDQAINNHNQSLRANLQRCRERNIKINLDKCKFLTEEVTYIGHTLTNAGLKPDEEKIRAIIEFPAPRDLHNLRRFIGMVKYLSKFDYSLTTKCEPLNRLTWKELDFPMGGGTTKSIRRHKESYSKHTYLGLLWLRKASHDTDWHVWCRIGSCPPTEWKTSITRIKGVERLWKELPTNWKRDESRCVWTTQV